VVEFGGDGGDARFKGAKWVGVEGMGTNREKNCPFRVFRSCWPILRGNGALRAGFLGMKGDGGGFSHRAGNSPPKNLHFSCCSKGAFVQRLAAAGRAVSNHLYRWTSKRGLTLTEKALHWGKD